MPLRLLSVLFLVSACFRANAAAVVAGQDFFCGILNGKVHCKYFVSDSLGLAAKIESVPREVQYPISLSAGSHHVCAIYKKSKEDLTQYLACWGSKERVEGAPQQAPEEGTLITGLWQSCGRYAGKYKCWGSSDYPATAVIPPAVQASGTMPILGDYFGCAIVQGQVQCWGENCLMGCKPLEVPPASNIKVLGIGSISGCMIDQANKVVCWEQGPIVDPGFGFDKWPTLTQPTQIAVGYGNRWCAVDGGKLRSTDKEFDQWWKPAGTVQEVAMSRVGMVAGPDRLFACVKTNEKGTERLECHGSNDPKYNYSK
jgi:hypothetical protein